jgi:hypothetical protein
MYVNRGLLKGNFIGKHGRMSGKPGIETRTPKFTGSEIPHIDSVFN